MNKNHKIKNNIILLVIKKPSKLKIETDFEFIRKKFPYDIKILYLYVNWNNEDRLQVFLKLENEKFCEKIIGFINKTEDSNGKWFIYLCNNTKVINNINSKNINTDINHEIENLYKINNNLNILNKIKLIISNYPNQTIKDKNIKFIKIFLKNNKNIIKKLTKTEISNLIKIPDLNLKNYQQINFKNFDLKKNYKTIIIKNILNLTNIDYIINLFNSFGNIKFIIRDLSKKLCFIEYFESRGAINSLKLNGLILFKNQIKIYLSNNLLNLNYWFIKSNISNKYKLIFIDSKSYRFNNINKIKINNPNRVLFLNNIENNLNEYSIYKFLNFNKYIIKIKKIKNNFKNSSIFNIEFNNISKAIEILSIYHDKIIKNNKIKISFSYAKLEIK